MIRLVAVDDEPLALEIIEAYCAKISFIHYLNGFTNTAMANEFIEKNDVDVLLLDINMPAISGVAFFKNLRRKPLLVFSTSYTTYAVESYEIGAIDYLLKPYSLERFQKAMFKVSNTNELLKNTIPKEKCILLKADYGVIRIELSEILYIEGLDNYLKIYLHNQPPTIVRITLKAIVAMLPPLNFIRVHRSYIVALNRVELVRNKVITIAKQEIPISKSYEEAFFWAFRSI